MDDDDKDPDLLRRTGPTHGSGEGPNLKRTKVNRGTIGPKLKVDSRCLPGVVSLDIDEPPDE